MAETAFSAVEHALENQPVGGLQIRECGFDSRPDLQHFKALTWFPNFHIKPGIFTFQIPSRATACGIVRWRELLKRRGRAPKLSHEKLDQRPR